MKRKVILVIMDGWGLGTKKMSDAIQQSKTPFVNSLYTKYANSTLVTCGEDVGLPEGQMGNSEVGHLNIGAGRIVYQELQRINVAIKTGELANNKTFLEAVSYAKTNNKPLHLMGLVSDGGVHAHINHLTAICDYCKANGLNEVYIHAFTDGRDTDPKSGLGFITTLTRHLQNSVGKIATISGRYYAMDRDQRWERMAPAYAAIAGAQAVHRADTALQALQQAYARGETDEFVAATVLPQAAAMQDGDAVVFMNFRADRARQLTACFTDPAFNGFDRVPLPKLSCFVCLSEYDARFPARVAYPPESLRNTLAEVLAAHGKTQLRIAETEKYAHVTFFFNGGVEQPVSGEERILIPSPKVATYDLQPEMSCPELTVKLTEAIASGRFDAIICNIANPDMVGHTGSLPAAIKAAQAVDRALADVRAAVDAVGGILLVTADHGNVEMMRDPGTGEAHTAHTVGPVYFVLCGHSGPLRSGGSLRDIAPTLLELMALPQPEEMTGRSLIGNTA